MKSNYFAMPHPEKYQQLNDALWEYYKLCLPQFSDDDLYDLTRDATVPIEDTMRRLYQKDAKPYDPNDE